MSMMVMRAKVRKINILCMLMYVLSIVFQLPGGIITFCCRSQWPDNSP